MTILLALDPGKSSGVVIGQYTETTPYERLETYQPRGGARGFIDWWRANSPEYDVAVAEKFTPLQHRGFSLTLDSVEPLVVEGAMMALGITPVFQRPAAMYFMAAPGDTLAQKKKKAQMWLKEHSLWATGASYGHVDGADVNSSTLHSIAFLRAQAHAPTLAAFFPPR